MYTTVNKTSREEIVISVLEPEDYLKTSAALLSAYTDPDGAENPHGLFPSHLRPEPETFIRLLANLYAQRIPSSVTRYKACLASDPTVPVGLVIWQAVKDRTSTAGEPTAEEQQEAALVEAWNEERRTELDAEFERATDRVFYKNMKEAYHSVRKNVLQGRRCYYLEHLYVHRDHQRKRIGKALLEIGMRKADEEGVECYLEASVMGQPLYERNGFEIKEWVEIKGGDDYVTRLPAMIRAPSKMS